MTQTELWREMMDAMGHREDGTRDYAACRYLTARATLVRDVGRMTVGSTVYVTGASRFGTVYISPGRDHRVIDSERVRIADVDEADDWYTPAEPTLTNIKVLRGDWKAK